MENLRSETTLKICIDTEYRVDTLNQLSVMWEWETHPCLEHYILSRNFQKIKKRICKNIKILVSLTFSFDLSKLAV